MGGRLFRRRFRSSLGYWFLTAISSLALAAGSAAADSERPKSAVTASQDSGGGPEDSAANDSPNVRAGQAAAAQALLHLGAKLEVSSTGDVTMVHLEHRPVRDDDLEVVTDFPELKRLYLAGTKITDSGLAYVSVLSKLERLSLWRTLTTDAGLKWLSGLTRLKVLDVHATQISDAGLAHLTKSKGLEHLIVSHNRINGSGVVHLRNLPRLTYLDVSNCRIDAGGLKQLKSLPEHVRAALIGNPFTFQEVAALYGRETRVLSAHHAYAAGAKYSYAGTLKLGTLTDRDLKHLSKFPQLKILHLQGRGITDAGLSEIARLPKLTVLTLQKTSVTRAGLQRLRARVELESLDVTGTPIDDAGRQGEPLDSRFEMRPPFPAAKISVAHRRSPG